MYDMDEKIKYLEQRLEHMESGLKELRSIVVFLKGKSPLVEQALRAVASMGIDRDEFLSRSRKPRLVFARCAVAARLRTYTYTLGEIGRVLRRDHASASYYLKAYDKAMREPRFYVDLVTFLKDFDKKFEKELELECRK